MIIKYEFNMIIKYEFNIITFTFKILKGELLTMLCVICVFV